VPMLMFLPAVTDWLPLLCKSTARDIAAKLKTLDAVLNATYKDLMIIEGIGQKTGISISGELANMREDIGKIASCVNIKEAKRTSGPLSGKSFCLTGTMSRSRKDIESDIILAGGMISSVKKGLTYLVQADPSSTSSKSKKAQKLGIEIIGEDALMRMISK